jgi:hypothetical protein
VTKTTNAQMNAALIDGWRQRLAEIECEIVRLARLKSNYLISLSLEDRERAPRIHHLLLDAYEQQRSLEQRIKEWSSR